MEKSESHIKDILANRLTLEELGTFYPDHWKAVGEAVIPIIKRRQPSEMNQIILKAHSQSTHWKKKLVESRFNPRVEKQAIPKIVRANLTKMAMQKYFDAVLQKETTSKSTTALYSGWGNQLGKLWDGFLWTAVLNLSSSKASSPSLRKLNRWWPMSASTARLLQKMKDQGQYCIYTKEFISALASELTGTKVLEIAAGNGVLSNFLAKAGVHIIPTDDKSWVDSISYGPKVRSIDATKAIAQFKPNTVLCSWPPPDNSFESEVFKNPNIQRYIVIGSQHNFATGNRKSYVRQTLFKETHRIDLEKMLFPLEANLQVLEFNRI